MSGTRIDCDCDPSDVFGIEYSYGSPNRFDGVSEWLCEAHGRRGRWCGQLLADGQSEPRYCKGEGHLG